MPAEVLVVEVFQKNEATLLCVNVKLFTNGLDVFCSLSVIRNKFQLSIDLANCVIARRIFLVKWTPEIIILPFCPMNTA